VTIDTGSTRAPRIPLPPSGDVLDVQGFIDLFAEDGVFTEHRRLVTGRESYGVSNL